MPEYETMRLLMKIGPGKGGAFRDPDHEGDHFMAANSVPSGHPVRTTRHHRCDEHFLGLLEEDFGIDAYSLSKAFMRIPPAPKKQAIQLCEWAIRSAKGEEEEEAGKALRTWAKKHGVGRYDRRLVEAPPATWGEGV
jgi:hypothetical protein